MPKASAGGWGVSWCSRGTFGAVASARPGCGNQTALALSLAHSLTLFGNQLLEVKIKGGTPAMCSGVPNPCLKREFSPFFALSTATKIN